MQKQTAGGINGNLMTYITLLTILAGLSGTWAIYGERIRDMEQDQAAQRVRIKELEDNAINRELLNLSLEPLRNHLLHNRDALDTLEERQERMEKVLYKVYQRVELLYPHQPPPIGAHVKGSE